MNDFLYTLPGLGDLIIAHYTLFLIIFLLYIIYVSVVNWKIFTKAGLEGWKGVVPILNLYYFTQLAKRPNSVFLVLLGTIGLSAILPSLVGISGVPFYLLALGYVRFYLAKEFKKNTEFSVGVAVLYPVFGGILAFNEMETYGDRPKPKERVFGVGMMPTQGVQPGSNVQIDSGAEAKAEEQSKQNKKIDFFGNM